MIILCIGGSHDGLWVEIEPQWWPLVRLPPREGQGRDTPSLAQESVEMHFELYERMVWSVEDARVEILVLKGLLGADVLWRLLRGYHPERS